MNEYKGFFVLEHDNGYSIRENVSLPPAHGTGYL